MKNRKTKQKEIILDVMKNNYSHPTISEICQIVKKIDPTIGQATIYRNINKYVEEGILNIVRSKKGVNHYDFYNNHGHFECLKCGSIIDMKETDYIKSINDYFTSVDKDIKTCYLYLEGYCSECKKY